MLSIKPIGSNQTELSIGDLTVLFSYRTPVAYHISGHGYFRTDQFWSVTTSKHINRWIDSCKFTIVTQAELNAIVEQYVKGE